MTLHRSRPIMDAAIVAGIVFVSFVVSALIVLWKAESASRTLSEATIEAAAWRASAAAEAIFRHPEQLAAASDSQRHAAHAALNEIRAAHSPVSALSILNEDQNRVVAHSSESATREELTPHPVNFQNTGQAFHIPGANGTHSVLVPIDWGGDKPAGFVRAEGSTMQHAVLLAVGNVLSPVIAIAAVVAALVGFLVFNASGRFHQAFTRLAEMEKRLRDIADAAGEYIWEVDASGKFTFLSDRVTEVLGYTPAELIGRHPFELIDTSQNIEVASRSRNIVNSAQPFRDFEHRMIRKDKRPIWISVNGVPVFDSKGALRGYTGTALDITSRKTGEEALIREKESAQAATLAKSQFLAMMSHEIRTPLNSVLGFTELLGTSELTPAQREHVDMIRKNGEGLLLLLSDILEFSQADTFSPVPRPKPTVLASFLGEVLAIHTGPAETKGLVLHLEIADDVPPAVNLDPPRVRQILINLIGNAVKFTEKGSVNIRVGAFRPPMSGSTSYPLRIAVSDSGPGIPAEKRPRLFLPFSQGDSSPTRRFGGTGLGLAICEKLANLLGASVHLAETNPSGSTFCLDLECEITTAPQQPASPTPPPYTQHPELRVLVAEDNPASRRLMKVLLQKLGVTAAFAEDGQEALSLHTENPFDLIFMDLQMPRLDGIAATRAIRQAEAPNNTHSTIVALTADAVNGDRERCIAAGMDHYISKPVRRDAIEHAIELAASQKNRRNVIDAP